MISSAMFQETKINPFTMIYASIFLLVKVNKDCDL